MCDVAPRDRAGLNQTRTEALQSASRRLEGISPIRTSGKEVVASSVTPAFGAPAETKKALYVVALSRVRRLRSSLDPVLTPVTGLPSPEPPLAALAKPARNHRHVRNWARTHVLCVAPHCKRFERPENKKTLIEDNPLLCRANFACGPSIGCSGSARPMHVFHEPHPGRRRRPTGQVDGPATTRL
jgi:hypothetical protein